MTFLEYLIVFILPASAIAFLLVARHQQARRLRLHNRLVLMTRIVEIDSETEKERNRIRRARRAEADLRESGGAA